MPTLILGVIAIVALDTLWQRRRDGDRRAPLVVLLVALALVWPTRPPGAVFGKSVGRLLMPVGLLWAAGLVAVVLTLRRQRRAGLAVLAGWLTFTALGNEWLAATGFASLEAHVAHVRPLDDGPPFDAIVVLGGGVGLTPAGAPQAGMAGDRVLLAARMYHRGRTTRLIAVGAAVPGYSIQDDAAGSTARIWRDLGVPETAIVVHRAGAWNTRREIAAASVFCRENGWHRVGLITSAWHLRRALKHCERADWTAHPLPADWRGLPRWDGLLTIIPNGMAFAAIHQVCWEYLGAAVGR